MRYSAYRLISFRTFGDIKQRAKRIAWNPYYLINSPDLLGKGSGLHYSISWLDAVCDLNISNDVISLKNKKKSLYG